MERAALIKDWKYATQIHYWSQIGRVPQPPSIVQLTIPTPDNRRRDNHNYCGSILKAVIDGLVKAGAWPDDTPEFVGHREPILEKGTIVTIELTSRA